MPEQYGHFELVKKLATGGMAQIYLARHKGIEGFERLCVVKRILPHLAENDDFIKMFLDEAKIAARLNHPNIVQIYDLGAQEESFYLAMEYIHGEDLRRIWKRADQRGIELPIGFVLRVIADAAAGLDYAHKRVDAGRALNIVHRDISPQNILVSFEGGVKVVDFGIAKAADKMTHTRSGVLKGKYSYMSPEQAEGSSSSPVDHRTDIFALGIVLYELLTGTRLFKRNNDIQTLTSVMECKVAPPSEVNARVPRELDALVMKALQKRASDRYQDARELQIAIEEWLIAQQLPASSAHVAEFMRSLYEDRLAGEQSLGGVVNPDAVPEIKSGEEEISPRGMKRTPTGQRPRTSSQHARLPSASSEHPRQEKHDDATSSLRGPARPRPPRPSGKAPTVSLRSSSEGAPRRSRELAPETNPRATDVSHTHRPRNVLRAAVVLAAAVGIALVVVLLFRPAPPQTFATVRVQTDPPGATLIFDGRTVPELSPATLPQVPAGEYTLVVGKNRYRDQRVPITVPASGEVTLPTVRLVPVDQVAQRPDSDAAAPARVALKLDARPAGARILVGGEERGSDSVELAVDPGSEVRVRVELADHKPQERTVRVGQGPAQTESFELTPFERGVKLAQLRLWSPVDNATVVVDGRARGRLPQTVEVAVGAEVTVRADAQGYEAATRRIRVTQARQTERIDLDRQRVERDPAPRAMGTIRFAITPVGAWAEVACGPHKLGSVPPADKQLPVGVYECTFTNPDLGTRKERVEVRPNGLSKFTVKFN